MPISSFKEQLEQALGPEITIIDGYSYLDTPEDVRNLNYSEMNAQLAPLEKNIPTDGIEFIKPAPQEIDLSLNWAALFELPGLLRQNK